MGKGTSHIILKNTHKHQKKVHQHFMFLNSPQTTEFYPGHRHQNIVAGRYFTWQDGVSSSGLRCSSQVPAALLLPTFISQSTTPPPSTPQELFMWTTKRVRPFHRGEGGRDCGVYGPGWRGVGAWKRLETTLRPVRDLGGGKLGGLLFSTFLSLMTSGTMGKEGGFQLD